MAFGPYMYVSNRPLVRTEATILTARPLYTISCSDCNQNVHTRAAALSEWKSATATSAFFATHRLLLTLCPDADIVSLELFF